MATTVYLAPDPINSTQFIPGTAIPAVGAQLFHYLAGSSTKADVYVDNTGTTKWANPIVLDSGGNLGGSNEVWIPAGVSVKFVLAPATDTDPPIAPYKTWDNLSGINDATSILTEWIPGPAPTFVSTTSFTLVGDQTANFTPGRRVKTTNTAGTRYGTISTSVFGAATTVTITNDSGTLDSGLSAVWYSLINAKNTGIPYTYHILNFGAVGDDSTDDNTALQNLLSKGGRLLIGGGKTYRNLSANLTLVSSTELYIEKGTTLHLDTTRLTASSASDVHIFNSGSIKSTNLNTTDALPAQWFGRGIVEFGGTTSNPAKRVGIYGPGEVFADFAGTPGSAAIIANDRRRGIAFQDVISGYAINNNIHGIFAEGLFFNGVSTSADIEFSNNRIHDSNQDALSASGFAPATVRFLNNIGWNCLNGVESSIGEISNNFMFNMVGSGYGMGGSSAPDAAPPLIFANNVGLNNSASDFDLEGSVNSTGTLIVKNNVSLNAGAFGIVISFARTADISGNFTSGWGRVAAGSGIATANNGSTVVSGNTIVNEGVSSNGGYNISGFTVWGVNNHSGVVIPYLGGTVPALNLPGSFNMSSNPAIFLTNQTTTVGASTATLTNSPHSGNPTIWPRINLNGTTFCFPAFLTT